MMTWVKVVFILLVAFLALVSLGAFMGPLELGFLIALTVAGIMAVLRKRNQH